VSELQHVVDATRIAHRTARLAMAGLLPTWQQSRSRLMVAQFWKRPPVSSTLFRDGVRAFASFTPFASTIPRDITCKAITADALRLDSIATEYVSRRPAGEDAIRVHVGGVVPRPSGVVETAASLAAMHALVDIEMAVRTTTLEGAVRLMLSGPELFRRRVSDALALVERLLERDRGVLWHDDPAFLCLRGGNDAFRLLSKLHRLKASDDLVIAIGRRTVVQATPLRNALQCPSELKAHTFSGVAAFRSMAASAQRLFDVKWPGLPWSILPSLARYTLELDDVRDARASVAPLSALASAVLSARAAASVRIRSVLANPTLLVTTSDARGVGALRSPAVVATPTRAAVTTAMRTRACRHQIPIDVALNVPVGTDAVDRVCLAFEAQRERSERTRFFVPFAAGDWRRLEQFPSEAGLLFDLVPVPLRLLHNGLDCVCKGGWNAASSRTLPDAKVLVVDRQSDPTVVAFEPQRDTSYDCVLSVVFSHASTVTAEEPVNITIGASLDDAVTAARLHNGLRSAATPAALEGAAAILWNAERIAQAVYLAIGTCANSGTWPRVHVALPDKWNTPSEELEPLVAALAAAEARTADVRAYIDERVRNWVQSIWTFVRAVQTGELYEAAEEEEAARSRQAAQEAQEARRRQDAQQAEAQELYEQFESLGTMASADPQDLSALERFGQGAEDELEDAFLPLLRLDPIAETGVLATTEAPLVLPTVWSELTTEELMEKGTQRLREMALDAMNTYAYGVDAHAEWKDTNGAAELQSHIDKIEQRRLDFQRWIANEEAEADRRRNKLEAFKARVSLQMLSYNRESDRRHVFAVGLAHALLANVLGKETPVLGFRQMDVQRVQEAGGWTRAETLRTTASEEQFVEGVVLLGELCELLRLFAAEAP